MSLALVVSGSSWSSSTSRSSTSPCPRSSAISASPRSQPHHGDHRRWRSGRAGEALQLHRLMLALLAILTAGWGTVGALMPLLHPRRMLAAHSSASILSFALCWGAFGYALWLCYGVALRDVRRPGRRPGQRRSLAPCWHLTGLGTYRRRSPVTERSAGFGISAHRYRSRGSLRSSTAAARRQRIVSGENGSVNGIPFDLRSGLPSRRTRCDPASTPAFLPRLTFKLTSESRKC
jgi:hypothetical protein